MSKRLHKLERLFHGPFLHVVSVGPVRQLEDIADRLRLPEVFSCLDNLFQGRRYRGRTPNHIQRVEHEEHAI
jgi:hypothetical protein